MINKEVRALLPAWTVCAVAILASRWRVDPFGYLGVPAYFIGTVGLGAWVMGHEYADGMLSSMLTLPVTRPRIWIVKLGVVAGMLAALTVLGMFFVHLDPRDRDFSAALFLLAPLLSLFVAPWLTMLTRSPLAGAVFTLAALGGSLALGEWIGELRYGFTNQVDVFRVAFLWWTLGGLSAFGAAMSWRRFATLEAPDRHGVDLELSLSFRSIRRRSLAGPAPRRYPLLRLITKELRLQQLPIVIAVLWALAYIIAAASGIRQSSPSNRAQLAVFVVPVMTAFYSLVLPAVIGSLACAEERHFGTLDAQLLLPVRCSTQWIVKSAIALALSLILTLLLPLALARIFGNASVLAGFGSPSRLTVASIVVALGVTSISLYVSTLGSSGLRALMGSIAAVLGFVLLVRAAFDLDLGRKASLIVLAARHADTHSRFATMGHVYFVEPFAACLVLTLFVALALPHYRYAARRPGLVIAHAAIVFACVLAYDVMLSVLMTLRY